MPAVLRARARGIGHVYAVVLVGGLAFLSVVVALHRARPASTPGSSSRRTIQAPSACEALKTRVRFGGARHRRARCITHAVG